MLSTLYIENIAVIERAELTPAAGFNVLTGETGAGKSIILDAIHAITGGRSSRDLLRTGQTKATVQAKFDDLSPEAIRLLQEAGAEPEEGGILLSREMYADGRNLCRAGGKPCPLSLLRDLGAELVAIHGQHDGRQLMDPAEHLGMLDGFAGTEAEIAAYRAAYDRARALRRELMDLQKNEEDRARRCDLLAFQIGELETLAIRPGELEEIGLRRKALENSEKIVKALTSAAECLLGERDAVGAESLLSAAGRELVGVAPMSPEAAAAADRVAELASGAEETAKALRDACDALRGDPGELEAIRERMDALRRALPKYGGDETAALGYLDRARQELSALQDSDARVQTLTGEYQSAVAEARTCAKVLSDRRREAARRLESAVEAELAYLEMPGCRFVCTFTEGDKLSPTGTDKMEFFISPNPGEEPKALAKTASGGELSRIMLALRNVFRGGPGRTLIFDEIDTGVSGRAAQRVGEKLYGASRGNQVLCVTHLSQIAAMGDVHFLVSKEIREGRTVTRVEALSPEARAEELCRITGGFRITDTLLAGAKEQLRAAEDYKKSLQER